MGGSPAAVPAAAPAAPRQAAPIEAEFLTHLNRVLDDPFAVDSVSMAEDLIRRIDYSHQRHHNAAHNKKDEALDANAATEAAEQGANVWMHAMEKFKAVGGNDPALADQAFHTTLENVMSLENESRPYWTHKGHDLHNIIHWHEDEVAHDIGLLMRSVMNPTIGGADYVKLDMFLQRVVHRVIQERGEEGYNFLEAFFAGSAAVQQQQQGGQANQTEEGQAQAGPEEDESQEPAKQ
jgi:hypothetical protein